MARTKGSLNKNRENSKQVQIYNMYMENPYLSLQDMADYFQLSKNTIQKALYKERCVRGTVNKRRRR